MKPVLVTGATGHVGRHVVAGLAAAGVPVRALTRNPVKAKKRFNSLGIASRKVRITQGDLSSISTLYDAAAGCGQVFIASPDNPQQVHMEMDVVEAAFNAGVGHIMKLSSCDAAEDAPFAWARNHASVESQIAVLTNDYTFLRPHYFMQNLLDLADEVSAAGTLSVPAGEGRLGMVDARDIAATAVAILVANRPLHRIVELTGPEPVSFAGVAAAISSATGREVTYRDIPEENYLRMLVDEQKVASGAAVDIVRLYANIKTGAFDVQTDEVQKITGSAPRTVEQFARDHAASFGLG